MSTTGGRSASAAPQSHLTTGGRPRHRKRDSNKRTLQLDLVALNKIVGILVGVSAPNSANAGSIAKNSNPALTMANIATVDVRHRSFCCSFVLGITIKPG